MVMDGWKAVTLRQGFGADWKRVPDGEMEILYLDLNGDMWVCVMYTC